MGVNQNRYFFPYNIINEWLGEKKIEIKDGNIYFLDDGVNYKIEPACLFVKENSGKGDQLGLIGKVKTKKVIQEELKGEIFIDFVVIDELSYEIIEGYIAEPKVDEKTVMEEKSLLEILLKSMK